MRSWSPDHPKAKLLERKQQVILDAARLEFLRAGYGGTSMEAVARTADVSIATLYRHALTKEELFRAIVRQSAEAELFDAEQLHTLTGQPLRDALLAFATRYLEVQLGLDRVALQRMVIAEMARFPDLGADAYAAGIGGASALLGDLLGGRSDGNTFWGKNPREAARRFLGMLAGDLQMRTLLGVSLPATAARSKAEYAARVVDAFLGADRPPGEADN
jgi:TetR/AcrR family transcriptional repressor of mexJK operon